LFSRRQRAAENRHNPCEDEVEKGRNVPNRDSSAGFRLAMLSNGRPEQVVDDGAPADARPACVALVPTVSPGQSSQASSQQLSRPSAIFVTHLIATAERAPQTRSLRRATAADAQAAYSANQPPVHDASFRTRQII
jgi:hypothetical protein